MNDSAASIRDDAGRQVPVFQPNIWSISDPASGTMTRAEFRAFARALRSKSFLSKAAYVLVWGFAVFFAARIAATAIGWAVYGVAPGLNDYSPVFMLVLCLMATRGLFNDMSAVRAALRKMGRCASCGYDMSGAPTSDDGLAGCPECGARWRPTESSPPEAAPGV